MSVLRQYPEIERYGRNGKDGCGILQSIIIPDSLTEVGLCAFQQTPWYDSKPDGTVYLGKALYKYKGIMPTDSSITIQEGTASISADAFRGCRNLVSMAIPDSVTSIGYQAFKSCGSLESIEFQGTKAE